MTGTIPDPEALHHGSRRMSGRDPGEAHRAATPLELLFDLTFVISFGAAASQFAHGMAEGHFGTALIGLAVASFGICWAWSNHSWFASAYDTDDWVFRVLTMVQMMGVLVLAIGVPRMFASLEEGSGQFDGDTMVLGYVVMRVALVILWLRAAIHDAPRRRTCLRYAALIITAQVGWTTMALTDPTGMTLVSVMLVLFLLEVSGPIWAERSGGGTPWHSHHMVERHVLFVIIALGEGIIGTLATVAAVVDQQGWSWHSAMVCLAGTGLTFGMWWVYMMLPSAPVLHARRDRVFGWAYTQLLIVVSIVATGAGLHVAAYILEGKAHVSPFAALLMTAVPVAVFTGLIYGLYYFLVRRFDPFHRWLLALTVIVMGTAVLAAKLGLSMPACLCILMLAPVVTVVGYEWKGHRHQAESLAQLA